MARVAVVLCGCGRADGSEIHESVSVLMHLSRLGAEYRCFAPDANQAEVINHVTGKPMGQTRNCLVESARISRGEISPLSALEAEGFDAVFFPGGFGAAKNLCTFAKDGANMAVNADVERVIKAFHGAGKPIGLCCIAPVLAARVLGRTAGARGCEVTIGDDAGVSEAIAAWGSKNVVKPVDEAVVCAESNVVTTPAYMYGEATPHEVFTGIGRMVEETLARCDGSAAGSVKVQSRV
ncbi:MAG: isoprenoid biosynthesis glyoxalase ElbB [Phycisphaerales bacterium]